MHHIIRGALGVAVVYPLMWHYSSQGAEGLPATTAVSPAERRNAERAPPERAAEAPAQVQLTRTAMEPLPAPVAAQAIREPVAAPEPRVPEPLAAQAPSPPRQPSVQQAPDPLAELGQMPEMKEALAEAGEVQRHAANPAELERALQGIDDNPAKLARLKALADLLVKLPPPRGDAYLPSSGSSVTGTAPR